MSGIAAANAFSYSNLVFLFIALSLIQTHACIIERHTADDKRLSPPAYNITPWNLYHKSGRRPVVFTIGRLSFVWLISTGILLLAADGHGLARASPSRKSLNASQNRPKWLSAILCPPYC